MFYVYDFHYKFKILSQLCKTQFVFDVQFGMTYAYGTQTPEATWRRIQPDTAIRPFHSLSSFPGRGENSLPDSRQLKHWKRSAGVTGRWRGAALATEICNVPAVLLCSIFCLVDSMCLIYWSLDRGGRYRISDGQTLRFQWPRCCVPARRHYLLQTVTVQLKRLVKGRKEYEALIASNEFLSCLLMYAGKVLRLPWHVN